MPVLHSGALLGGLHGQSRSRPGARRTPFSTSSSPADEAVVARDSQLFERRVVRGSPISCLEVFHQPKGPDYERDGESKPTSPRRAPLTLSLRQSAAPKPVPTGRARRNYLKRCNAGARACAEQQVSGASAKKRSSFRLSGSHAASPVASTARQRRARMIATARCFSGGDKVAGLGRGAST